MKKSPSAKSKEQTKENEEDRKKAEDRKKKAEKKAEEERVRNRGRVRNWKAIDMAHYLLGAMLHIIADPAWVLEIEAKNKNKVGAPFQYHDDLIYAMLQVKMLTKLPYRKITGFVAACIGAENTPHYSTLHKRMKKLVMDNRFGKTIIKEGESITIAVDSSGVTPSTRSEWIRFKWKMRRGFIKLHVMIDADTLKVISFTVTSEKVGDATQFKALLDMALKNIMVECGTYNRRGNMISAITGAATSMAHKIRIEMLGDAAYDSREIFKALRQAGVTALIRMRINAQCRSKGISKDRAVVALAQLGNFNPSAKILASLPKAVRQANQKKWKKDVEYGRRWLVEIFFSTFKQTFGGAVAARNMDNVERELMIKICTYNETRDILLKAAAN